MGIALVMLGAWIPSIGNTSCDGDELTVEQLIGRLASPDWTERETATDALLSRGATVAHKLRLLEAHPDPEVRTRAAYIVEQIDPWIYDGRIYRVAAPATERRTVRVTGFADFRLLGSGGTVDLLFPQDGGDAPVSLLARAIGDGHPLTISVTFGKERNSATERCTLEAGAVAILRQECLLETVVRHDGVERSVESVTWIIACHGIRRMSEQDRGATGPPTPTREEAQRQLLARLGEALQAELDSVTVAAVETVGWLASSVSSSELAGPEVSPLLDRVREIEVHSSERIRFECRLALLRAGDSDAAEQIEEWLGTPVAPDQDHGRDLAAIELARRGSAIGLDALLSRIGEMPSWLQYQSIETLTERWDTFSPEQVTSIFGALTAPEVLAFLPWYTDGIVRTLFRTMLDSVDPEVALPMVIETLSSTSTTASGGIFRMRALLAGIRRFQREGKITANEWLPTVLDVMTEASVTNNALQLIHEAILTESLDETHWALLLEKFGAVLASDNQTAMRNVDNTIDSVLAAPGVPIATKRRLWKTRIDRLPKLEAQLAHLRRQIDQQLIKKFGALSDSAPRPNAGPKWAERAKQWTQRLNSAKDDVFVPVAGERRFWFVEAELKITTGQPVEVLRFDQYELRPRLPVQRREPGRAPATVTLDSYATSPITRQQPGYAERFLLSRSATYLDVPTLRTSIRGNRVHRFTLAEGDYRPRALPTTTATQFRTLSWLRPENSPCETFDDVVDALVEGCTSDLKQKRDGCRRVIAEARVNRALLPLQTLYEAKPSSELAITLLQLGDFRGRAELLDGIEKKPPRDVQSVMAALISAGDEEALQMLLRWITRPPARLRSQSSNFLRTLDEFCRRNPDRVEKPKWIEVLVSVLDQRTARDYATRILRQITGEDFGYARRYQEYPDPKKRSSAENEIIASWREWYARYRDREPKPEQD